MTKVNPTALDPYLNAKYVLMPLHRWDEVDHTQGKRRVLGKCPIDKNWTRRPYDTFDADQHMKNGGNVGIRLRPYDLVVDVDPRSDDGRFGVPAFVEFVLSLGVDPTHWPTVCTGGGGYHYYLKKPEDIAVKDSLPDFPGVEFKTVGRQVVAAGSVHPSGKPYLWDPLNDDVSNAPPCPQILLDAICKATKNVSGAEAGVHTPEELKTMLDALNPEDFREHARWFQLMQACHHATSGLAEDVFIDWSVSDSEYLDEGPAISRRWESLDASKDKAITVHTLYMYLKDADRQDLIPRPSAEEDFEDITDEEVRDLVKNSLSLPKRLSVNKNSKASDTFWNAFIAVSIAPLIPAFDELKQQVVFQAHDLPWNDDYGRNLDENTIRLVRHYLINKYRSNDYQPSKDNVYEAISTLAYENKFNPTLQYLDTLTWDGVSRVKRLFTDYFKTEDSTYAKAVSTCFMVAAVRRQRQPGCKFDTIPVLRGPQGCGKSTGIRYLFGDKWFSDAEIGDLKGKDAPLTLQGIWVQEFAELDGMKRADVDTFKAFSSRAVDRVRPPYGRSVMELPRRCVFIGTANEGGFLKDGTGNRRFWPLHINAQVNLEGLRSDRDQLWAEANYLESQGTSIVLGEELWLEAAEHQASETSEDPWVDVVHVFLGSRFESAALAARGDLIDEEGEQIDLAVISPPEKVHTSELLRQALGISPDRQNRMHCQRLRTVMEQAIGWKYKRSLRIGKDILAGYEAPNHWKPKG